jgi:phage terminase large subunit GpA-like protein
VSPRPKSIFEYAAEGLMPGPRLSVSEWADARRVLSRRESNEPGAWRTPRVPYIREPMDCMSAHSSVREAVLMWGAQLAKSELLNNVLGYVIDECPGPTMMLQPTLQMAQRYSKHRIAPMVASSPTLRAKVRDPRERDSGNTTLLKEFSGGIIVLAGANSAAGLRSMPIKYLLMDEIDSYPGDADGEGDPMRLAERGQRTFDATGKRVKTSTPTIDGRSRIQAAFQASDRSRWYMPCPDCGREQILTWSHLRWDEGDPSSVRMACESCGALHEESKKNWMLERGRWVPELPERSARVRGFHLSGLCSPYGWYSWRSAVEFFLESKGRPDQLRVFVNTVLGEVWREASDPPPAKKLYQRRSRRPARVVPDGALILTAGVDVQKDRIEVEVCGWGRGLRSWSIEHLVLPGSPEHDDVWKMLEQALTVTYPHASVEGLQVPIRAAGLDTAHATTHAYAFARRYPPDRVFALRGDERVPTVVGSPSKVDLRTSGKRLQRSVLLWRCGVGVVKSELYGWLNQDPPPEGEPTPPGWCDFPSDYAEEYFHQLTAEQLVPKMVRGHGPFATRRYVWEKSRERNEGLDLRVYNRVTAEILGLSRWTEADWQVVEQALVGSAPLTVRPAAPPPAQRPRPERSDEDGSGYWDGY